MTRTVYVNGDYLPESEATVAGVLFRHVESSRID